MGVEEGGYMATHDAEADSEKREGLRWKSKERNFQKMGDVRQRSLPGDDMYERTMGGHCARR